MDQTTPTDLKMKWRCCIEASFVSNSIKFRCMGLASLKDAEINLGSIVNPVGGLEELSNVPEKNQMKMDPTI